MKEVDTLQSSPCLRSTLGHLADPLSLTDRILANLTEAVCVLDAEWRITYVNPQAALLLQRSAEELLGRIVWEEFPDTVGTRFQQELLRAVSGRVNISFLASLPALNSWCAIRACPTRHDLILYLQQIPPPSSPSGAVDVVREGGLPLYEDPSHPDQTCQDQTYPERQRLQRRLERLTALRAIDASIITRFDLHLTLRLIAEQARRLLGVHAVDILLLDRELRVLRYGIGAGFQQGYLPPDRVLLTEGPAAQAAREQRMLTLADLPQMGSEHLYSLWTAGETFADYYAVPLLVQGELRGVLQLYHRETLHPDRDWLDFLEIMAGQAAIAIDNAMLARELEQVNRALVYSHDTTIEGWSRALDLRDKETEGHSVRVTEMTLRLAEVMGLTAEERVQIRRGALLHDVGKLGVPDSILLKPGPLTEEEWVVMRRHPQSAYEMLYPITFLHPALDIPYCHHERWDGTGYPNGLRGEEIPLAARIFAVADVWDALRSDRPYRGGWPVEKVREYIMQFSGTHFDPDVVAAFAQLERTGAWNYGLSGLGFASR